MCKKLLKSVQFVKFNQDQISKIFFCEWGPLHKKPSSFFSHSNG